MTDYAIGTKKLGQLLVERGWITGEQLIRAIQSQRMVGGRIGTCLLEMDVLTEDRLLDALSEQLRVPAAGIDMLRGIDTGTVDLVPAKVAFRCRAIPFFSNSAQVKVATLDVHNLSHLDELKFCTNKNVVPYIANEVRIFEALERYYRLELPRRYGHLLDRLNRSRYLWDESAKILFGAEEGGSMVWTEPEEVFEIPGLIRPASSRSGSARTGTAPAMATAAARPIETRVEASPAAPPAQSGLHDTTPMAALQPQKQEPAAPVARRALKTAGALRLEDVDRLFGQAEDQHQLADVMLKFLRQSFDRAAIFKIMPDRIGGWKCSGEGFSAEKFRDIDLRLDIPSILFDLRQGKKEHVGSMPPLPAHLEIARSWGGGLPKATFFLPVHVRRRLVCVLFGDLRQGRVEDLELEPFRRLAVKAAMAFELFILRRRVSEHR